MSSPNGLQQFNVNETEREDIEIYLFTPFYSYLLFIVILRLSFVLVGLKLIVKLLQDIINLAVLMITLKAQFLVLLKLILVELRQFTSLKLRRFRP